MTDQAAAEALVSVGQQYGHGSSPRPGPDDTDGEMDEKDQPKRKRARKSTPTKIPTQEPEVASSSMDVTEGYAGGPAFDLGSHPPGFLPGGPFDATRAMSSPPVSSSFYPPDLSSTTLEGILRLATTLPSVAELDKYYADVGEQRKRLVETLERTDQLLGRLERGIEEMRRGIGMHMEPMSVPLPKDVNKGKSRESVWAVSPGPS